MKISIRKSVLYIYLCRYILKTEYLENLMRKNMMEKIDNFWTSPKILHNFGCHRNFNVENQNLNIISQVISII